MPDLVAGGRYRSGQMRVGVRRVPGDEEGGRDTLALEQPQDTLATDRAELPTRDHARRPGREGTEPERDGVEVEGQANGRFRRVRCHHRYRAS